MKLFVRLMVALFLCSVKLEAHGAHHPEEDTDLGEELHWTKEKTEFANIQVQVAGPGTIQNFVQVSGKVVAHPDYLAFAIPKVSGSVYEVRKNIGDSVEQGEILAWIESQEIADARAAYLVAAKKYAYSQAVLAKEMQLQGISSGQDLWNAELAADQAEIELKVAAQHLQALGLTQDEVSRLPHENTKDYRYYGIKAPLKGKVLKRNLTLGEWTDSSTHAFTVGNFEKVWVEVNVPPSDVPYLKEGQQVEILGGVGKLATAKLSQFAPVINEETRTATAIALIENTQNEWSPGQFVTAQIQTDVTQAAIVVPLAAIQMVKGEQCLFVENGQAFIPCAVKLGKMDRQNVEIINGIPPGVSYAARNTFCLKAEFEKEEVEHHH